MKKYYFLINFVAALALLFPSLSSAATLSTKYDGRFLLQTQNGGQLWYVSPVDHLRHKVGGSGGSLLWFLASQTQMIDHSDLMQFPFAKTIPTLGTDKQDTQDIDQDGIPDAVENLYQTDTFSADTDKDGFDDEIEILHGYNPLGKGKIVPDKKLLAAYAGKIVVSTGDPADWYIGVDGSRYAIPAPDLFAVQTLAKTALGMNNVNLAKIPVVTAISASEKGKVIDCGEDPACMAKAAATCSPARIKYHYLLLSISGDATEEIVGAKNGQCTTKKTNANIRVFVPKNATADEKHQAENYFDSVKTTGADNVVCAGSNDELVKYFTDLKTGDFSADVTFDFSTGAVTSTGDEIICHPNK
jgi:hypothetical protein